MKPVDQTRTGCNDGNCFAACLASILEIPLTAIDFTANDDWLPVCNSKIEKFGYRWLEIDLKSATAYPLMHLYGQICVFTGPSPRFESVSHCVVGRIMSEGDHAVFDIIHDPHPSREGIKGDRPEMLGFFIPINPENFKI